MKSHDLISWLTEPWPSHVGTYTFRQEAGIPWRHTTTISHESRVPADRRGHLRPDASRAALPGFRVPSIVVRDCGPTYPLSAT